MKSSANLGVLCASALITFLLSSIHHNQLPEAFVKNFAKKTQCCRFVSQRTGRKNLYFSIMAVIQIFKFKEIPIA